jgi:hypothetical protein
VFLKEIYYNREKTGSFLYNAFFLSLLVIKLGLSTLCVNLSLSNAALLAHAVIIKIMTRKRGGEIWEGEFEGYYCLFKITLQLHCWTKSCNTFADLFPKLGYFADFLKRGAVKLRREGGAWCPFLSSKVGCAQRTGAENGQSPLVHW